MQIRVRDLVNPGSGIEKIGSGIRDKHPGSQHCVWVNISVGPIDIYLFVDSTKLFAFRA